MPYNVSCESDGRTERTYCETASKALRQHAAWNADGRKDLRVVSVEGTEVPIERLAELARFETYRAHRPAA